MGCEGGNIIPRGRHPGFSSRRACSREMRGLLKAGFFIPFVTFGLLFPLWGFGSGPRDSAARQPAAKTEKSPGWFLKPLILSIGPHKNICGITAPEHPDKTPGLIIWFHGGMNSPVKDKGGTAHLAMLPFIGDGRYYLASPSAFRGQDWLSAGGMESTGALINYMLKTYAIDKTNINLAGVSDGCLAVIGYSLRTKHPIKRRLLFSSFPALVINREGVREQKVLYQGTWHFFQGGKDRLFPGEKVLPFLNYWEHTIPGTRVYWFPEGLHDFSFYAEHAEAEIRGIFK
ncbi:hypothetical protein ACFL5V_00525 [Fibrobacterota bacterium]